MPSSCSAVGCKNRKDQMRRDRPFKTMPTNEKLKKAWKDNIRRAGDMPWDKSIVLCWEHFTEECLERDFKAEFKSGNNDPVYKIKDAIPTVFSYTKVSSRTS